MSLVGDDSAFVFLAYSETALAADIIYYSRAGANLKIVMAIVVAILFGIQLARIRYE